VFDERHGDETQLVMWRRIPWVANGLTVQGGLEVILACALLLGAMDSDTQPSTAPYDVLLARFGPGCLLVGGALKAFAAAQNRRFRNRRVGLAALWSAVPTALVWMCAPTGLVLLIYGVIVYRDQASRDAFALGDEGTSPEEVARTLAARRP